jgi:hypothetical protein
MDAIMKKLIAAVALCATTMAHAGFLTGNELLTRMKDSSVVPQMVAMGYVIGIADAMDQSSHCLPDGVTMGQVRDVVKQFLEVTPEVRHRPAELIVYVVLKNTWACAEKKKGRPGA